MRNLRPKVTHVYAGNPLDRGEAQRRDEQWLIDRARDTASRFLPMRELNVPIVESSGARLGWLLDPIDHRAYIYRTDQDVEILENPTTLSGEDVLPDFVFEVGRLMFGK